MPGEARKPDIKKMIKAQFDFVEISFVFILISYMNLFD